MNKKDLYRKLVREEELTLEEIEFLGDTSKANLDLPFKYVIRGDKFFCSRNTNLPNLAPICSPNNNLMEKIDGMTLASYCSKVGPNSPACKEITQHWKKDSEKFERQLDLKDNSPSNVMVDKDQKIHFIDPEFWSRNTLWEKREPTNWFQKLLKYLDL